MNINDFFQTLEYLQESYLPKNTYPKNAIFSNTYKNLDYILSKNLSKTDSQQFLVFYSEDDILDCIGIDNELAYIKKLNDIKIDIPNSVKRDLDLPIIEGLKLFDKLYNLEHQNYLEINLVMGVLPLYFFYANLTKLNNYKLDLLLTPFGNNPIKKDLYLAQFEYFIKKYVMFRLTNYEAKTLKYSTVSNATFKNKLTSAITTYCSGLIEKSECEYLNNDSILLEECFKELVLFPLD